METVVISPWAAAGLAAMVVLSVFVYAQLFRHLWLFGGKVRAEGFGFPDLLVASMFVTWFGGIVAQGFSMPKTREVAPGDLVADALLFGAIIVFLSFFLHHRGIKVPAQLGFSRVTWWKIPIFAGLLLITILPLVIFSSGIMHLVQKESVTRQVVVEYFVRSVREGNWQPVWTTFLLGAVVAPIAEEFLFRGYLYGVLKRYAGLPAALVLTSALFAAIHLNLTSLLPLFVLAVALTVAYEITGSILVNMTMHALFNICMFGAMLREAQKLT